MKFGLIVLFFSCFIFPLLAQTPGPFVPDSNTVALWHFDESSGTTLRDASSMHNDGIAVGTSIVSGKFVNARYFNGFGDYAYIPDPPNGSLDFDVNQSFTLEAWFKTTSFSNQRILRKGLAPAPGYELLMNDGYVGGIIGNRQDGSPPDTLLVLKSSIRYNDNVWHLVSFVRDREARKLFLYVDGFPAAAPITDNFPYALSNSEPLTIGRWASTAMPLFFTGTIDEVRISNIARHPRVVVSDTVALWHLDEVAGTTVFDSSPFTNNGTASGTSIVTGRFGNARFFDGVRGYVHVPHPGGGVYDLNESQSFTVRAWVKTTGTEGIIVRKGLVPWPGFQLSIHFGHAIGIIGNHKGSTWNDTLLMMTSTNLINDNAWHEISMVRDRGMRKLFLYVDGISAAEPQDDNFMIPIANTDPLSFAVWISAFRDFFVGSIDEVAIFRGARHPGGVTFPIINVTPPQLNFGNVLVGGSAVQNVVVTNLAFSDTLHVTSMSSNNSTFAANASSFTLLPGASRNVQVTYAPTIARVDTGTLSIASNDSLQPVVRVRLTGQGFSAADAPFITSIRDIPEDQGKQVRVIWYRSRHDSVGDPSQIASYSLWRRVGNSPALWDFIASVPAVRLDQYAYVAPTLFDSTRTAGIRWSVFRVSAHTASGAQVFFSTADSGYSIDNIPPSAPTSFTGSISGGRVTLTWVRPTDPDIHLFAVYRSTLPNFIPSAANELGTTATTAFVDQSITPGITYFYRVAAFDTAGNQGAFSNQIQVGTTGVVGTNLPSEFALHQNFPNPFNPSAVIRFDVPTNAYISIKVYDMLGREIETLIDRQMAAGEHSVTWDAGRAASGVYLYKMQAGSYVSVKKMILMK